MWGQRLKTLNCYEQFVIKKQSVPHTVLQCCGSGSALGVRIRIQIQDHGNVPKLTSKPCFLVYQKAPVPSYVCFLTYQYNFHVKRQLFVTLKSNQDPDPHWFSSLDPDLDPY
jgi:hypothetical protein